MKALILFDSYFGNTEKIARVIAEVLTSRAEVTIKRVNEFQAVDLKDISLLVLGSPTRGFRPTEAMQAFLAQLPPASLTGVGTAAFDTRIDPAGITSKILKFMMKSFGYADKPMLDAMQKKGASLVSIGQGFIVLDSEGPLKEGELERAAAWAATLI